MRVCESLWVWDSVDFIVIFVLVHGGKAVTAQNWYPVLLADSGTFFSFLCRQAGVLVLDLAAERILPLSLVHWLVHACSFSDYSVSVDAGFGFNTFSLHCRRGSLTSSLIRWWNSPHTWWRLNAGNTRNCLPRQNEWVHGNLSDYQDVSRCIKMYQVDSSRSWDFIW